MNSGIKNSFLIYLILLNRLLLLRRDDLAFNLTHQNQYYSDLRPLSHLTAHLNDYLIYSDYYVSYLLIECLFNIISILITYLLYVYSSKISMLFNTLKSNNQFK